MRLSYRKKTERSEQFLRSAMRVPHSGSFARRIKIRPFCLLGFSPREKRRKLREAERKRLCCFRRAPCLRCKHFLHSATQIKKALQEQSPHLPVVGHQTVTRKIEVFPSQKDRAQRAVFAISHVRFARMRELSHGVLKSEKKVCSAFRPAKNDANSAKRKEKGYARFGKYPVCFS